MIWNISEGVLLIGTIVAFLIAIEIGFRCGYRHTGGKKDEALGAHVNSLQSALLGLLALLLGFTFAMSISRFDLRERLVLEEANTISTTYLRSSFLPPKHQKKTRQLLHKYVDARLDFYRAGNDGQKLQQAEAASQKLATELWSQATEVSKNSINPVSISLFVQSLNLMINANEERMVAYENRVPESVVGLLFFVATCGMSFIGYNYGLTGKRRHGSTALFALLIAVVLIVILDIDRPRRGLIQVSQVSLERLKLSLAAKDFGI